MRPRTRARELALQFLYTLDARGEEAQSGLADFLKSAGASQAVREFATSLIEGYLEHREEIDRRIAETATHWALERIAMVDRNILRLASFELLYRDDIPDRVSLNEAIELAKRYSTADSGGFINGVLDKLRQVRPDAAPGADVDGPPS